MRISFEFLLILLLLILFFVFCFKNRNKNTKSNSMSDSYSHSNPVYTVTTAQVCETKETLPEIQEDTETNKTDDIVVNHELPEIVIPQDVLSSPETSDVHPLENTDPSEDLLSNNKVYDSKVLNNSYAHSGPREDLNCYFRSSWEANIARLLKYKGIDYTYKEKWFDDGKTDYYPDFIVKDNVILDIKSIWSSKSLKEILDFRNRFPEYTILPIDSDTYFDISRLYSGKIALWESPNAVRQHIHSLSLVGMKYLQDKEVLDHIEVGSKLTLLRDPENRYDHCAINAFAEDGRMVGRVSADWATVWAPKMDLGMEYTATVSEIKPTVIKIKVKRTNFDSLLLFDIFE